MSRDMTKQSECAPSEDSDQHGHPPSLIRVFAVRMKKAWVLSYPLSAQRRLWSDWADAQADLSLRWAHTHLLLSCCGSNKDAENLLSSFISEVGLPYMQLHDLLTNTDSMAFRALVLYTSVSMLNEPPHDKTNKMTVHPAKTQISQGIRPVWSESSLSAWRKLGSLATHWAHREDWSDWADLSLCWAHSHIVGFIKCLWFHRTFRHLDAATRAGRYGCTSGPISQGLTVRDVICANDGCMILFVPGNDPICAKAMEMVGVFFFFF